MGYSLGGYNLWGCSLQAADFGSLGQLLGLPMGELQSASNGIWDPGPLLRHQSGLQSPGKRFWVPRPTLGPTLWKATAFQQRNLDPWAHSWAQCLGGCSLGGYSRPSTDFGSRGPFLGLQSGGYSLLATDFGPLGSLLGLQPLLTTVWRATVSQQRI